MSLEGEQDSNIREIANVFQLDNPVQPVPERNQELAEQMDQEPRAQRGLIGSENPAEAAGQGATMAGVPEHFCNALKKIDHLLTKDRITMLNQGLVTLQHHLDQGNEISKYQEEFDNYQTAQMEHLKQIEVEVQAIRDDLKEHFKLQEERDRVFNERTKEREDFEKRLLLLPGRESYLHQLEESLLFREQKLLEMNE